MKIRVLQFKRFMPIKDSQSEIQRALNQSDKPAWITLGHYDSMQTHVIDDPDKSIFDQINKEQNELLLDEIQESAQVRKIYLFCSDDEETWDNQLPFMAVLRVHFSRLTRTETFRKHLQSLNGEETDKVEKLQLYYTAEPSNCVILCASASMWKIAKLSYKIRRSQGINKVNTSFCISCRCLTNGLKADKNDQLESLTMTFSVRRTEHLDEQIKSIQSALKCDKLDVISGQNDLQIFLRDVSPQRLIDLYIEWFGNHGISTDEWSFMDVTTSIGTRYTEWASHKHDNQQEAETDAFAQICTGLYNYFAREGMHPPEWFWQVSSLVSALRNISSSGEMNEFFFLFYPSAKTMLSWMQETIYSNTALPTDKVSAYLEKWRQLHEIVVQSEGRTNSYPELHPRIHSISFMLMEYIMAFVYLCQDFLKDDEQDSHDILVLPTEARRIETEEIFPRQNGRHGLITISIPSLDLGEIGDVLRSLNHEISHFVGEKTRAREERIRYYARTITALLCHIVFYNDGQELIEALAHHGEFGMMHLESYLQSNRPDGLYTSELMTEHAQKWLTVYFQAPTDECARQVLRNLLLHWNGKTNIPRMDYKISTKIQRVKDLCVDYGNLFREVYADICMIKTLGVDEQSYVRIVTDDLNRNPPVNKADHGANSIMLTCVRILICARVCGLDEGKIEDFIPSELHRYLRAVKITYESIDQIKDAPFNRQTIEPVMEYASYCSMQLDQMIQEKGMQLKAVKDAYKYITAPARNANVTGMEKVVDGYRERVLPL